MTRVIFFIKIAIIQLFVSIYSVALSDKVNCGEIFARHEIFVAMRLQFVEQMLGTDGLVVVKQGEGIEGDGLDRRILVGRVDIRI